MKCGACLILISLFSISAQGVMLAPIPTHFMGGSEGLREYQRNLGEQTHTYTPVTKLALHLASESPNGADLYCVNQVLNMFYKVRVNNRPFNLEGSDTFTHFCEELDGDNYWVQLTINNKKKTGPNQYTGDYVYQSELTASSRKKKMESKITPVISLQDQVMASLQSLVGEFRAYSFLSNNSEKNLDQNGEVPISAESSSRAALAK